MKKHLFLLTFATTILASCHADKPELFFHENTLFSITPTTDPNYCNKDLIVPTDCGIGYMFFTKEGKVIYSSICMGMDSSSYSIGNYFIADTGITCNFSTEYAYFLGCQDCPDAESKVADPNSGNLHLVKEWSLILKNTTCNEIPYYIANYNSEYHTGLEKIKNTEEFTNSISEIDALKRFITTSNASKLSNAPNKIQQNRKETTSDEHVSQTILNQIVNHYDQENETVQKKIEENDSTIFLSYYSSEDMLPFANMEISKIKSSYWNADLNADGQPDMIAEINSDSGGSIGWYDYIVFLNDGKSLKLTSISTSIDLANCPRGSNEGNFIIDEIKGGVIYGTTTCHTENDPSCCPSVKTKSKVTLKNNKLGIFR